MQIWNMYCFHPGHDGIFDGRKLCKRGNPLCLAGYHGLYCEEEYNECLSAPCQNYATCRDLINAYECVCTPQYEGVCSPCVYKEDGRASVACTAQSVCAPGGR